MSQTPCTTRRSLVKGAAAGLGFAALASGTAASGAFAEETSYTFADTIAWNAEYDVVVVGFGGAGAVASIYAADAGARVLLCDVAPQGKEGGNTRFAAQMVCSGEDPDMMFEYYKGLAWEFEIDEEAMRAYTDGMCQMPELFAYMGVDEPYCDKFPPVVCPEYPELPGGETVYMTYVYKGAFNSSLWQVLYGNVMDRADKIDVWYESPAVHLVQDPQSKTIVGVEIARNGETVLVRAKNGVVMACGGFENNTEMKQDYLGAARIMPIGTLHNDGSGVRMGIEVGAAQWHMEAYESLGILAGNAWAVPEGEQIKLERTAEGIIMALTTEAYGSGSVILVGDDGGRFMDESNSPFHRHGHVYSNGVWRTPIANYAPHLIFDQAKYDEMVELGYITEDRLPLIVSAETPEELAQLIGADPEILARTIEDFNFYAENGRDYEHGRPADSMAPITGTLYAAEFRAAILNTQGGPRRNKDASVVDTQGNPIPHLYSAGELGGMCAFQYNSGGNLAECMVFGKIAGQNAAAEKPALAPYTVLKPAEPNITYVAGEASDAGKVAEIELTENEYLGTGAGGMGGDIQVAVTLDSDTISTIAVVSENETPGIGGAALPTLVDAVVAANGTEGVDAVAGATMTSNAFLAAVNDALAQAGR